MICSPRKYTWPIIGILLSLFPLCISSITLAAPASLPEAKSQLTHQQSKINSLKELLSRALKINTKNEHELKTVEVKISSLQKQMTQTEQRVAQQQQELKTLENQISELQTLHQVQHAALEKNIRAAYRRNQQTRLQLILNQKDPEALSRLLKYYDYITRSQLDKLRSYQVTLTHLQTLNQQKNQTLQKLQRTQVQLATTRQQLHSNLAERKAIVQATQAKIQTERSRLSELEKDQKALSELVTRLNRQQQLQQRRKVIQTQQATRSPLTKRPAPEAPPPEPLRGDLIWPTQGQITHRFGEQRAESQLTWNGIFISAASGTPVVAVRPGVVVFADWLRGFGLLLIIDHENGYLSLYGDNATLSKHVGDRVRTGETIASVGQSGGNDHSGLYFEIRAQGRPVNPLTWMPRK